MFQFGEECHLVDADALQLSPQLILVLAENWNAHKRGHLFLIEAEAGKEGRLYNEWADQVVSWGLGKS